MKDNPIGPAEELRAAATLIRETASNAVKGMPLPWTTEPGWKDEVLVASSTPHLIASCRKPQADWIALVSPDRAEPLAAWLEATADEYDREPCDDPTGVCNRCEFDPSVLPALTFAAEILGRAS